ncbi:uncharacterized protein N7443_008256 [Penicillium atrosanguineum]|uniref:uncharacterized protein n=1 Tax=Penicillium atrosanguineum TaxID=1132637 RepID=UPI002392E3BC|nr:uncharacterized protein N7443_008256 [Penicillium atrosanguineum]KAJ5292303.1 hypothetical protein N7443_008256 [Penicillium atrosanguineum]
MSSLLFNSYCYRSFFTNSTEPRVCVCSKNPVSLGPSPDSTSNMQDQQLFVSSGSPAQSLIDEAHEGSARPTAQQACKECRRRKSKCDRLIPNCALCHKFGRQCIYEKQMKTPLTRRYLTEVENETDQVNFSTPSEDPVHVSRSSDVLRSQLLGGSLLNHRGRETTVHSASPQTQSHHSTSSRMDNVRGNSEVPIQHQSVRCELQDRSPGSKKPSQATSGLSLETPTSPSNFEWDERNGSPSGDKFVDGMASLPSASHKDGYLGVASGAALLRIIDTKPTGPDWASGLEQRAGTANHPISTIPFALNSLGQLEPFVDAYFSLFHRSYPIVHEATFRAQFTEVIPRPAGDEWQVLLFIIAAVGGWTTATEQTDLHLGLFEAAKARLSIDMLETGNPFLVQALTLLSNYMQKINMPNSGYNYMGLARRIAMGIGLHKEFPSRETSLFNLEMKRRIWHCLYIFDVGAIITFSRPLDFPSDGIDVGLPMNVHDTDFTQGAKLLPQPADETTVYTHLRAQATFHMATSKIYSRIISSPFPSASELIDSDDRLIGGWLNSIPSFFQESVRQQPRFRLCHSILRWRYRNFRILMYRPFLLGRLMARPGQCTAMDNSTRFAIQRCLDASRETVELISQFWAHEQRSMMACWYGLYFLFQAILIPVICLRNNPQEFRAIEWVEQIQEAMRILESMAILNPTALRCLSVIKARCGTYLENNSIDGRYLPTEESPQTQLAQLYPLMWPTLEMAQLDGMGSVL